MHVPHSSFSQRHFILTMYIAHALMIMLAQFEKLPAHLKSAQVGFELAR